MKIKIPLIVFASLVALPLGALAIDPPIVDHPPAQVDADTYTLKITTEKGAKVSVIGGPSNSAPVTDGKAGDLEDGIVLFEVGLAQNEENGFSITAEKSGAVSEAAFIIVKEVSLGTQSSSGGTSTLDNVPPEAPKVNPIPDTVSTAQYWIFGNTEPDANIYVRRPDKSVAGSSKANDVGFFKVLVSLEKGKTNRFNISAEDGAGNEGPTTQAVIRATIDAADLPLDEAPKEEDVKLTSAQIFFDDTGGHWAEEYINELREEEVVSGKTERIFDPNGLITRAELTKIAMLAFGHSVNTAVEEHPFSDVPKSAWFAPYVEEAKRLGVVQGYPEGGFGPNDFITRAAALKIILEAAMVEPKGPSPEFWDVPTESWFMTYVAYAKASGIVGGYEDGSFRPGANITRAEVAKIVVEVLKKIGQQVKGECIEQYQDDRLIFDYPCDWEIRTGSDDGIKTIMRVVAPDARSVLKWREESDLGVMGEPESTHEVMIGGSTYQKYIYPVAEDTKTVIYARDGSALYRFDLYHQNNVGLYEMERMLDSFQF